VSVEHDLGGQGCDDEVVDDRSDDATNDQHSLSALLARSPVGLDQWGGDEVWVEVEVSEEEGGCGQGLEAEVKWDQVGLKRAEGSSWHRLVALVSGLQVSTVRLTLLQEDSKRQ
jgi:hypothetical protein